MYAKYINETTIDSYIPRTLEIEGKTYTYKEIVASKDLLNKAGYYDVIVTDKPEEQEGFTIKQKYVLNKGAKNIVLQYYYEKNPDPVYKYSKNKILTNLIPIGKAGIFLDWLEQDRLVKAFWDASLTIDSDNQMFQSYKSQIRVLLGVTEEQLEDFLSRCISDLK